MAVTCNVSETKNKRKTFYLVMLYFNISRSTKMKRARQSGCC